MLGVYLMSLVLGQKDGMQRGRGGRVQILWRSKEHGMRDVMRCVCVCVMCVCKRETREREERERDEKREREADGEAQM